MRRGPFSPSQNRHAHFKRSFLQQENKLSHVLYNRKSCNTYVFSQEKCKSGVISSLESCSTGATPPALWILPNAAGANVLFPPSTLLLAPPDSSPRDPVRAYLPLYLSELLL